MLGSSSQNEAAKKSQLVERVQTFIWGVAAIAAALLIAFQNYASSQVHFDLAVSGVTTQATVVGVETVGSGRGMKSYPIFKFSLPGDEETRTAKSYTNVHLDKNRQRRPVEVVYSPSNLQIVLPRKHLIFWLYIWVWVLGVFILSLLMYGLYQLQRAVFPQKSIMLSTTSGNGASKSA
jgi:type VI protein secretion system component VasF